MRSLATAKYAVAGTLLGALLLFCLNLLTSLLPPRFHQFTNDLGVAETVRQNAPENGIYSSSYGIFAVVSFRKDFSKRMTSIKPLLLREFLSDVLAAFLLTAWMGQTRGSAYVRAKFAVLTGCTASVLLLSTHWNWLGFPALWVGVESFGLTAKFCLTGLLLAALHDRLVRLNGPKPYHREPHGDMS
jgi:hypothetical protein